MVNIGLSNELIALKIFVFGLAFSSIFGLLD